MANDNVLDRNKAHRNVGSNNGASKLDEDDVREIRQLFHEEDWRYWELAEEYPIGRSGIKKIIKRQTWSHVE